MSVDRQNTTKEPEDKFVVRMPCGMKTRLAELAKDNDRSLNREILHRLERIDELETDIQRANQVIDRLLAQQSTAADSTHDAGGL